MADKDIIQMFSDLTFDSQRHLYYWKGIKVPYSVSGLVEKFAPKFNAEKMLPFSARKASIEEGREVTVHELRHKWQTINKTACDLGTGIHEFMEKYTGLQRPTRPQEEAGIKYIKSLEGKYKISFRELRAYSTEFNYAGTMDIPLESIENPGHYIIDDYKTNGDLFKSYDYLKPPFDYLQSSAYNKYQIQLCLYQIMLEDIGLKIIDRRIIHLKADTTYTIYPLQDFTADLRQYLKNR